MFKRYNQLVLKRPLVTNMVTTGILFGTGDCLAQKFFPEHENSTYDYQRSLRSIIYGTLIFAPMGDKWYKFINTVKSPIRSSNGNINKYLDVVTRVAGDQLVFAPFVGIPMYYTMMTFMEFSSNPLDDIRRKLNNSLWPTLKTNWLVWPAFQMLNFSLIPVQMRLLLVNVVSIGWNCYLSYIHNKK